MPHLAPVLQSPAHVRRCPEKRGFRHRRTQIRPIVQRQVRQTRGNPAMHTPQPGQRRIDPVRHPPRTHLPQHRRFRWNGHELECEVTNVLMGHRSASGQAEEVTNNTAQVFYGHPRRTQAGNRFGQRTGHLPGTPHIRHVQIRNSPNIGKNRRQRSKTNDPTPLSGTQLTMPIRTKRAAAEPPDQLIGQHQRTQRRSISRLTRRPNFLDQHQRTTVELLQPIHHQRIRRPPRHDLRTGNPRHLIGQFPKILPVPTRQRRQILRHPLRSTPQRRHCALATFTHRAKLGIPSPRQSLPGHRPLTCLRHHQVCQMTHIVLSHRTRSSTPEPIPQARTLRPQLKHRTQILGPPRFVQISRHRIEPAVRTQHPQHLHARPEPIKLCSLPQLIQSRPVAISVHRQPHNDGQPLPHLIHSFAQALPILCPIPCIHANRSGHSTSATVLLRQRHQRGFGRHAHIGAHLLEQPFTGDLEII